MKQRKESTNRKQNMEVGNAFKGAFYKNFYVRKGSCQQCGKCCRHIYLRFEDEYVASFEDYFKLVHQDAKMKRFKPKGRDDQGLLYFGCEYISRDNLCTDYENRPQLCRVYPALSMLRHGATPKEGCGFTFVSKLTGKRAKVS